MQDWQEWQNHTPAPPEITSGPSHTYKDRLELLTGDSQATHAVILVGGIHDNFHCFDHWVPALSSSDNMVMGWDHDHQSMTMKEAAATLAQAINDLKEIGITDVTIVAHSMGGLVSKGAIDELSRSGEAAGFDTLDLHALGTPWGGFAFAELARYLPGSEFVAEAIGYPMGPEMGPGSDYLNSISRPMPSNGEFHLYQGDIDKVSTPERDSTKSRYASIEAQATSVTEMTGFGHTDYNRAPPELLDSGRGQSVPGFDVVELQAEATRSAKKEDENNREAQAEMAMSS